MQQAADFQAEIDKPGSVFFPGLRPESGFDLFKSCHALGIAGHKFIERRVVYGYHVPQGIGEIIRSPAELIRIIQTVGYQDAFGRFNVYTLFKGFMVLNGPANILDLLRFQRIIF